MAVIKKRLAPHPNASVSITGPLPFSMKMEISDVLTPGKEIEHGSNIYKETLMLMAFSGPLWGSIGEEKLLVIAGME